MQRKRRGAVARRGAGGGGGSDEKENLSFPILKRDEREQGYKSEKKGKS